MWRWPNLKKNLKTNLLLVCAMVLLTPAAVGAQRRSETGTIEGVVRSGAESAGVSGIALELVAGPSGVVEAAVTDENGAFSFAEVPPGAYSVRALLDGASTSIVPVQVDPGAVRSITVILGITEQLSVSAPRSRADPTRTESLAADLLERAPVADDVRALLPLLPGVVRGVDGRIQMKGGQPTQSGYQVSGASVTDPSTGDFAFSLPSEAVESVEALANPFSAEYGRFTSGVTEFRTRRGGDDWRIVPNSFIPRVAIRRDSRWALDFRSFTPRLTTSGPLVPDRLYLAQSMHYRFVDTPLTALPGEPTIGLRSFDSYTRVDTASTGRQQLTMALALFPRTLRHAGLNAFNPYEVTTTVRQRGFNAGVGHRWVVGASTIVESMGNAKVYNASVDGAGGLPMVVTPEGNRGSFFNDQRRDTTSLQTSTALTHARSHRSGEHLFKIGADVMWSGYKGQSTSRTIEIHRANGTLGRRVSFGPASMQDVTGTDVAVFGQDSWRVHPLVTLELGLRGDRDGVTRTLGVSPRAGLAISRGPDGQTVARGGVGVFYQRTPLNVGAFESFEARSIADFGADGRAPLGEPLTLAHQRGELTMARSIVWNAGIDHRIGTVLALRLNHLRRSGSREPIVQPLATPAPALRLSTTGRSRYWEQEVTLRYLRDERRDLTVSYVRSRATADLNAFDLFFGNARAPIIVPNAFTTAATDVPHRLLAWGTIALGAKWDVLPLFEIRNGFPFSAIDERQDIVGIRNQAGRFPVMASLDLAVQRHLRIAGRRVRVGLRVFNALNHRNYRDVQANVAASAFGRFFNPVERQFGATFWIDR